MMPQEKNVRTATFAGGCFWCMESIFSRIKGVTGVKSGYSGGKVKNPSYDQVCSGVTGHAESIQITFDPKKISYDDLLYIFLRTHNPTTPNRQGHDAGPQYRSVIFFHDAEQKERALEAIKKAQKVYPDPIVTSVEKFTEFYPAEDHHQNYEEKNPKSSYCQLVINPKIDNLNKFFKKYLK